MRLTTVKLATFVLFLIGAVHYSVSENIPSQVSENSYKKLMISVGENGNVFIEGAAVSLAQLKKFINELEQAEDYEISVLADSNADSDTVLKVMDICCNYKVGKVKLIYAPDWDHKG